MQLLNLSARQDYLEREASTRDPVRAISEFVWNALDADATRIDVTLNKNALGGLSGITISDNGLGISLERAEHDFANLGGSWKQRSRQTSSLKRAVHGKEGRGRLRFFSLALRCRWVSVYHDDDGRFKSVTLTIDANSLDKCAVTAPVNAVGPSGTTAELVMPKESFDALSSVEIFKTFSTIFAPYILQYPNVQIWFNGFQVDPQVTINRVHDIVQTTIKTPNRTIDDLKLRVIEWNTAIASRQIHFGGENGIVLGSQSAHVTAPGFNYSAYAYSTFFRELADQNLLEIDGINDPDFLSILDHIRSELTGYFRTRQAELARGIIQELKDEGSYPYEGEPRDEIERRERQVFDIATYAVNSYSREFSRADSAMKKITLSLLKESVKHNPDALSTILRAVVNLPKNKQTEFSELLKRTELGNIITASSMIADRVAVLSVLREIVFGPKYKHTIKERGELDVLVRDNTWLFGEQFHITLPEAGLTRIMNRVSEDLKTGRKVSRVRRADGKSGRADCFLGRVVPGPDQGKREYLLIELKRPSIILSRTELDQVEDYVNALKSQPDFSHTDTKWNFYLVASEYDEFVSGRVNQVNRPRGLYLDGDNYAFWVKTWAEIMRESESRHSFVQEQLQIEVSDADIEARITQLQSLVLK